MVQHVYQGETHRSLHFRCERHHQDYRAALRKGGRRGRGGEGGGEAGSSWMFDHIQEMHGGRGSEDPFHDFEFHLTGNFTKPLERQVDEMRRIDKAERGGKASIRVVGGKSKELKVSKTTLNRREERFNLGTGRRVRATFGPPASQHPNPSPPTAPASAAPAAPPPQPPPRSQAPATPALAHSAAPTDPPPPSPPSLFPAPAVPPTQPPPRLPHLSASPSPPPPPSPRPINTPIPFLLRRLTCEAQEPSPRRLRPRKLRDMKK